MAELECSRVEYGAESSQTVRETPTITTTLVTLPQHIKVTSEELIFKNQ
jgi:hypothetical protein